VSARSADGALGEVASLYGVQRRYRDGLGCMRTASDEAVTAVLAALGAELSDPQDAAAAAQARRREVWAQALDPVLVAWDGQPPVLDLRLPASAADGAAVGVVSSSQGEQLPFTVDLRRARIVRHSDVDGREHLECRVALPLPALPDGEHALELSAGGTEGRARLLSAPRACFIPAADRLLGVFLPLYALHSEWSLGIGDLGDLRRLAGFAAGHGATLVGTTPLCAGFNEGPGTPSPYLPVSRLAWNELSADLAASRDLAASTEARRLLSEPGVRDAARAMTAEPLVDYARAAALRRPILSALAASVEGRRSDALAAFLAERPEVEAYARFRAGREGGGEVAVRDHAYAQWLVDEQLGALGETGAGLYLDLPLGVHPEGFDAQAEAGSFVPGLSTGAPPDGLFAGGQDWGFAPLHPDRVRSDAYRYPAACVRHHMRHADALRVDHVMGLHRTFVIPAGHPATDGVYLNGHPEELYAVLSLESARHGTLVVGEDLGTVRAAVREAMARHRVQRTIVAAFEIRPDPANALPAPPREAVASLNTHDLPPFAAYLEAAPAETVEALTSFLRARGLLSGRAPAAPEVAVACLAHLAGTDVRAVLVNLEDLWGETRPQNVPGTGDEEPNWRRWARLGLEGIVAGDETGPALDRLARARQARRSA
jgi:4-alpha-glucanotransferase